MESKETLELQRIIETWVHKKINTVMQTQYLARSYLNFKPSKDLTLLDKLGPSSSSKLRADRLV